MNIGHVWNMDRRDERNMECQIETRGMSTDIFSETKEIDLSPEVGGSSIAERVC